MNLHDRAWLGRAARTLRPLIRGFVKLIRGEAKPEPVKVRVDRPRRKGE